MNILVRAFQSLGEVLIEAKGLTVLVGPSHRGKSALIRAIQGALFNRPGTDFVRTGSKAARVTLADVPVHSGPPLDIEWEKGAKANTYRVNGQDFTRVGAGTPAPIIAAGFRDVYIGDAERKRGESFRPQVGSQFEPLFLLTRTPGFVADVLSVVQRRAVLTRAQDRCAADTRQQREFHRIRQADLAAAQTQEAAFEGLDALQARCKPTMALAADIEARQARETQIAHWRTRRAMLAALRNDLAHLKMALETTAKVQARTGRQAGDYLQKRTALERWQATRLVLTLPPQTTMGDLFGRVGRWQALTSVVQRRAATVALRGLTLRAPEGVHLSTLAHFVATAGKVEHQIQVRAQSYESVRQLTSKHRALGDDVLDLQTQLQQLQADAKVCPVCERPWTGAHS